MFFLLSQDLMHHRLLLDDTHWCLQTNSSKIDSSWKYDDSDHTLLIVLKRQHMGKKNLSPTFLNSLFWTPTLFSKQCCSYVCIWIWDKRDEEVCVCRCTSWKAHQKTLFNGTVEQLWSITFRLQTCWTNKQRAAEISLGACRSACAMDECAENMRVVKHLHPPLRSWSTRSSSRNRSPEAASRYLQVLWCEWKGDDERELFPLCHVFQSCHCQLAFGCRVGAVSACRRTFSRCHSLAVCKSEPWRWQRCLLHLLSSASTRVDVAKCSRVDPSARRSRSLTLSSVTPWDWSLSIPIVFQRSLENDFIQLFLHYTFLLPRALCGTIGSLRCNQLFPIGLPTLNTAALDERRLKHFLKLLLTSSLAPTRTSPHSQHVSKSCVFVTRPSVCLWSWEFHHELQDCLVLSQCLQTEKYIGTPCRVSLQ